MKEFSDCAFFLEKALYKKMSPKPQKSRKNILRHFNIFAGVGLLFAFAGLLLFWVPTVGALLWGMGIIFSILGFFRKPRAYAMFGLYVSALSAFLMMLFLGSESVLTKTAEGIKRDFSNEPPKTPAHSLNAKPIPSKTAKTQEENFAYEPAPNWKNDTIAILPRGSAEDSFDKSDSNAEANEQDTSLPAVPNDGETTPQNPTTGNALSVAQFENISRRRSEWPRTVRLLHPRLVVMTDEDTKEIIGRMEVPAGTRVRVLEVCRDSSLSVRDEKFQQVFRILAADTDFADAYAEKIRHLQSE